MLGESVIRFEKNIYLSRFWQSNTKDILLHNQELGHSSWIPILLAQNPYNILKHTPKSLNYYNLQKSASL